MNHIFGYGKLLPIIVEANPQTFSLHSLPRDSKNSLNIYLEFCYKFDKENNSREYKSFRHFTSNLCFLISCLIESAAAKRTEPNWTETSRNFGWPSWNITVNGDTCNSNTADTRQTHQQRQQFVANMKEKAAIK